MGKGDKKTRKGKVAIGSYGKKRPHNLKKTKTESAAATKASAPTEKKPSA